MIPNTALRTAGLGTLLLGAWLAAGCQSDPTREDSDLALPAEGADAASDQLVDLASASSADLAGASDLGPPPSADLASSGDLGCRGLACGGGPALNLVSRAFNLCLSVGSTGPSGYKCSGSDPTTSWRLIETGLIGRYTLQNVGADVCLTSSGATLGTSACDPGLSTAWWYFAPIADDNDNHSTLQNSAGLCLSNDDLSGYSGGLSLVTCNSGYWTQQWKKLGAENEASGAADAPWLSHTRSCDDVGVVNGSCDANGKWWLETACESPAFVPVRGINANTGLGCIHSDESCALGSACILQRGFTPIAGTSANVFTMALDKINFPIAAIDDTYTDSFLTDVLGPASGQPTRPRLSNDYLLEVRMRLHAFELKPDAPYPGHARVLIGLAAVNLDTQRSMFVEVVLYRDAWYDLCTPTENRGGSGVSTPCDPSNLYDRRSAWATGEQVWYTGATLNSVSGARASAQATLYPDGQWYAYQIPVSRLFRAYGWGANVAPADFSRVEIEGVYLGLEQFGRARLWLDIDGYRFAQTANWQP